MACFIYEIYLYKAISTAIFRILRRTGFFLNSWGKPTLSPLEEAFIESKVGTTKTVTVRIIKSNVQNSPDKKNEVLWWW